MKIEKRSQRTPNPDAQLIAIPLTRMLSSSDGNLVDVEIGLRKLEYVIEEESAHAHNDGPHGERGHPRTIFFAESGKRQ